MSGHKEYKVEKGETAAIHEARSFEDEEKLIANYIADAICAKEFSVVKSLIDKMKKHPDVIVQAYEILSQRRIHDASFQGSCLDNNFSDTDEAIRSLTFNNEMPYLLKLIEALIIFNVDENNSNIIAEIAEDEKFGKKQISETLIRVLDNLKDMDIFGQFKQLINISKQNMQVAIMNSIVPLSGEPPGTNIIVAIFDIIANSDTKASEIILKNISLLTPFLDLEELAERLYR
jgi:hypothetical protein